MEKKFFFDTPLIYSAMNQEEWFIIPSMYNRIWIIAFVVKQNSFLRFVSVRTGGTEPLEFRPRKTACMKAR